MSGGVPAGWVLVPEVATEAMERAALAQVQPYHDLGDDWQMVMPGDLFRLAWPAMLAAVPATPTPPPSRDADVERVEKVARAICRESISYRGIAELRYADQIVDDEWEDYVPQARAALQALQALGERG